MKEQEDKSNDDARTNGWLQTHGRSILDEQGSALNRKTWPE